VAGTYSSSASFIGAILCGDMTLPAVYCKASLVLAKTKSKPQIEAMMLNSIQGEVSDERYKLRGKPNGALSFFEGEFNAYLTNEEDMTAFLSALCKPIVLASSKANKLHYIDELKQYDDKILETSLPENSNIFHSAVFNFSEKTVDYIVSNLSPESVTKLINQKDIYGLTPLDYAIISENVQAVECLRKNGAVYPSPLPSEATLKILE